MYAEIQSTTYVYSFSIQRHFMTDILRASTTKVNVSIAEKKSADRVPQEIIIFFLSRNTFTYLSTYLFKHFAQIFMSSAKLALRGRNGVSGNLFNKPSFTESFFCGIFNLYSLFLLNLKFAFKLLRHKTRK